MRIRLVFAALGVAGALALTAAPAQANASLSVGINLGHGHPQAYLSVHGHGGRSCAIRYGGPHYRPHAYGPRAGYRPYGPRPVPVGGCGGYPGRRCY